MDDDIYIPSNIWYLVYIPYIEKSDGTLLFLNDSIYEMP